MPDVFHFTDTARLPYILREGILKPGRGTQGGFPDPDFLWATTSPLGDRTASAQSGFGTEGVKTGRTRLVRFTLPAEDFSPWRALALATPGWTADHVKRLAAVPKAEPSLWVASRDPVGADRWRAIETKSWVDRIWRPLVDFTVLDHPDGGVCMVIEGSIFSSFQFTAEDGLVAYNVPPSRRL